MNTKTIKEVKNVDIDKLKKNLKTTLKKAEKLKEEIDKAIAISPEGLKKVKEKYEHKFLYNGDGSADSIIYVVKVNSGDIENIDADVVSISFDEWDVECPINTCKYNALFNFNEYRVITAEKAIEKIDKYKNNFLNAQQKILDNAKAVFEKMSDKFIKYTAINKANE